MYFRPFTFSPAVIVVILLFQFGWPHKIAAQNLADRPIGGSAGEIAQEMVRRFPVSAPVVSDKRIENNRSFWVGIPEFKVSLNRTAPPDQMGRYDARIRVHTAEAFAGFTGCAELHFEDARGNIVYAVLSPAWGVNGTAVPGAPSDRTETATGFIPMVVMTATARAVAIPHRCSKGDLERLGKTVRDLQKGAEIVADGIKKIGSSLAEITTAVRALP